MPITTLGSPGSYTNKFRYLAAKLLVTKSELSGRDSGSFVFIRGQAVIHIWSSAFSLFLALIGQQWGFHRLS